MSLLLLSWTKEAKKQKVSAQVPPLVVSSEWLPQHLYVSRFQRNCCCKNTIIQLRLMWRAYTLKNCKTKQLSFETSSYAGFWPLIYHLVPPLLLSLSNSSSCLCTVTATGLPAEQSGLSMLLKWWTWPSSPKCQSSSSGGPCMHLFRSKMTGWALWVLLLSVGLNVIIHSFVHHFYVEGRAVAAADGTCWYHHKIWLFFNLLCQFWLWFLFRTSSYPCLATSCTTRSAHISARTAFRTCSSMRWISTQI